MDASGNFALARYNPDGGRDTSFGDRGLVRTDLSGSAQALVLQPDGKLVAAGSSGQFFCPRAILRYRCMSRPFRHDLWDLRPRYDPRYSKAGRHTRVERKRHRSEGSAATTSYAEGRVAIPWQGVTATTDCLETPAKTGSMADSAGTAATVARGATRSPGVNAVRGEAPDR